MNRIALIALLISMHAYGAEQTATIDGSSKKVTLHEDGTWELLPEPAIVLIDKPTSISSAVTVFDTTILTKEVNYRQAVTLAIRYENHTSKRVTGLLASLVVKNGFGAVLHSATLQEDIAIEPGEKTAGDTYWHWDDNQFIKGEPYDKMWQAVSSNTAKVEVKVVKVVFEDGTILKSSSPSATKKKK